MDVVEEINKSHKESKYLLWQSLLTVDGFLLTVTVGIASFGPIEAFWVKILVELVIILLFLSMGLLVSSFDAVRVMYARLSTIAMNVAHGADLPSEAEQNKAVSRSAVRGKIAIIGEYLSYAIQFLVAILLIVISFHILFFARATNDKQSQNNYRVTSTVIQPHLIRHWHRLDHGSPHIW